MSNKFNFCIGAYWDKSTDDAIGCYAMQNGPVFYASEQSAKNTLEYVKKQAPDKDWRIFVVTEYEDNRRPI